jgi:hypothetical protein
MSDLYTAGSSTKNFGWNESYEKLHHAIRNGFSAGLSPISRDTWRQRSEIGDSDLELIPLNYFLYSMPRPKDTFVMVDRLVERSAADYDDDFAKLSLFTFNLAMSGTWPRSKWPDGRVAGWANEFFRTVVGKNGEWNDGSQIDAALKAFIKDRIDAEASTKRKIFTNYRYMLESAGALLDGRLQKFNLMTNWPIYATQIFWDRQIFAGSLGRSSSQNEFEAAFFTHEVHKLLGCGLDQGKAFVRGAYRDYIGKTLEQRFQQLEKIKGLIAA